MGSADKEARPHFADAGNETDVRHRSGRRAGILKHTWRWLFGPNHEDSIEDSIEEAAEQRLDKSAKLQTADEALWVNDTQKLLRTDRDEARRLKEWKVFGNKMKPQGDAGDGVTVADNIHWTYIRPSTLLPVLLAGLLTLLLCAAAWWFFLRPPEAEAESVRGRVRVFWGEKELKPGEAARVRVHDSE